MSFPQPATLIEATVASEELLHGKFLRVYRDTVRLPDGSHATREYVKHPGAVVVIPLLDDGRADLELHMPADLLHEIWLGERSLRESFFGGQIKTKGNVFKAMALGDLFREAEHFYPKILQEAGLR